MAGLPSETAETFAETVRYLGRFRISGIKLHSLYVMKNTALERIYKEGSYTPLTRSEYARLAADALISDYSSCAIPFYLQNKPVVHFTYDYEFYVKTDSGLIKDLNDIRFGLIAYNISDLCRILSNLEAAKGKCGKFAHELIEYEKGKSCQQCCDFIAKLASHKQV